MAFSVGRNAIIVSTQKQQIAFFNSNITKQMAGTYQFFSPVADNKATPMFTVNISTDTNKRCLIYTQFVPNAVKMHNFNVVLYDIKGTKSFVPIYQTINFSPTYNAQKQLITGTFWSNLHQNTTSQVKFEEGEINFDNLNTSLNVNNGNIKRRTDDSGKTYYVQFQYDPEKICKFEHDRLDQIQWGEEFSIIFVSVTIKREPYKVRRAEETDLKISEIPVQDVLFVTQKPVIIDEKKDLYPIVDFTTGGNGMGGMKQHSHIPNIDGTNFAFAVFHPGTSMPQLPWET